MKKRIVWITAALLALAVLAAAVHLSGDNKSVTAEEIVFSGERDILRASLTYDEGLRTLRGTQNMTIVNRSGSDLSEIVLRVYMNGSDEDAVAVSAVAIDGQPVSGKWEDPTTLRIAYPWKAGYAVTLSFTLMIKHAKADGAAVITLPHLAMVEDGAWRTDGFGELTDPSYAEAFDYAIELDGETVASMIMARDASFAIPGGAKSRERDISGVHIRALARDAGTAGRLLDQAQAALESLNAAGIAYWQDTLTVVEGDTGREDGLAFSGLIALDAGADKETLLRTMTRLIARQTFGILVENDPWNAPWLSHTLASCAEMLAYRERKGAAAYEERLYGELELATRITRPVGVSVGASTAHFGSQSEMTQVLRDQGAAMLLGIEQAVGSEAFVTALALYAGENAGKTGSLEALCAALEQATGSSWDGYLSDML